MSSALGARLPPAQVDCRWWKHGNCVRGTTCHFRHDEAMAGVDNRKSDTGVRGNGKGKVKSSPHTGSTAGRAGVSSSTASSSPAQIDCKWWKQGYCARGKTCHFRHDEALAGIDNKRQEDVGARVKDKGKAKAKIAPLADGSSSTEALTQICAICLETPDTFGLLINCDHVFCLECIRSWRSSTTAPVPGNDELKSASRTCPICRSKSHFIIPSSLFPSPLKATAQDSEKDNTEKKEIVDRYLSKLKNIPCRYFEESIANSRAGFRPKCKFRNGCHYAHKHPLTGEPYIFSEEELNRMRPKPRQSRIGFLEDMALMERIFNEFGGGYDSDDGWGCEYEEDLLFFESGFVEFPFGVDLGFDEFDVNYGWD